MTDRIARKLSSILVFVMSLGCPPHDSAPPKHQQSQAISTQIDSNGPRNLPMSSSMYLEKHAIRSPEITAAHQAAQAYLLRGQIPWSELTPVPASFPPPQAISLSEFIPTNHSPKSSLAVGKTPGFFVPIAYLPEQTSAFNQFYHAINELQSQREKSSRKVRILMCGASGTAADITSGYLRTYFQHRFGNGGPGFIPLGRLSPWYHHSEVEVFQSKGWRKEHVQISSGRHDGYYGLLGASFASSKNRDFVRIQSRRGSTSSKAISHYEIHFLYQPKGGNFLVRIDGKLPITLATSSEHIKLGIHTINLQPGPHSLELRPQGNGEVRLFGVAIETDAAGIVVDTLGIDGSRITNHTLWDESMWSDSIKQRNPALITLAYGANEAVDDSEEIPLSLYHQQLRQVLTRLRRVAPQASCLLIGPGDFPEKIGGQLVPRARLLAIIELQREVAPDFGCGFWDGMVFMGGFGSIQTWTLLAPPLARQDLLHFTSYGSTLKGMALSDAIMFDFDKKQ